MEDILVAWPLIRSLLCWFVRRLCVMSPFGWSSSLKGSGRSWKVFALTLYRWSGLWALNTTVKHCWPYFKEEGLAKGPLLFINLKLTDVVSRYERGSWSNNRREDKQDSTIMGCSELEYIIKEIKRRRKEYGRLDSWDIFIPSNP